MANITVHADCGEDPEKLALNNFKVAFAKAYLENILDCCTDDIRCQIVGEADLGGEEAVRAALDGVFGIFTTEPVIGFKKIGEGKPVAFCDFYRYAPTSGTNIESMMFCAIELPSGDSSIQKVVRNSWSDGRMEEALDLYASCFADARVTNITRYSQAGMGEPGDIVAAKLELAGLEFCTINGGPHYTHSPAMSLAVNCVDQD